MTKIHKHHSLTRRDIARAIKRKYYGKEKYANINEHLINLVITRIMELKVEEMFNKGYIELEEGFGCIHLVRYERILRNYENIKIDWIKTNNLWKVNPKAKEKKTLIRDLDTKVGVRYLWKGNNAIKNIKYFTFSPARSLRKEVYKRIEENKPIVFLS